MSVINPDQARGNSNTNKTFLTALATNAGLLSVEVGAFLVLKRRLWRIYSPRSYLPPPDKRAKELPSGPWKWFPTLVSLPLEDIIHKNGLDAYMFMRFLRMLIYIFLAFTLLTFVVIIPAIAVNVRGTHTGLERISWNNIIEPQNQPRFVAHIVVVYILTFFVIYQIRREMLHFLQMRHQFLISPSHSRLAQARTVLFTSVPDDLATERALQKFASFVPGGVDRVWILREHAALNDLFEQRQNACITLEAAETSLLATATKAWRKREAAHRRRIKSKLKDEEGGTSACVTLPSASRKFLDELVPPAKRPRHRTHLYGLLGKKVDTIDWCMDAIVHLNAKIEKARARSDQARFLGTAFIRCNLQIGAHVLAQCVSHHEPLKMYDKWMEANPKDIVWQNLYDGAIKMRPRYVISWLATMGLIIAWGFPVALIGTLSNLDDLCVRVPWLRWVCEAPSPWPGLVQGVLPPVLFALLFCVLPWMLRGLAWYERIPRYSLISISVYRRFFLFLLVHGFLIVTLSSGVTKALQDIIEQPTQKVQELARQLPGASIFFLTYIVTQGMAGAGGVLAQFVPLVIYYIRKWFLGRTPRQAYEVTFLMPSADLGVILPRLSLLATIGFAYSVLSPLINLLALITFSMLYVAWKFLFTQVLDQTEESETGGLYFPMAVSNLFVGLYIEQICLACLFFLKAVDGNRGSAIAQGVSMLVLVVITLVAQVFLKRSFSPIINYLPMSLATRELEKKFERKRQGLEGMASIVEEEIDLFSRDYLRRMRKRVQKTSKKIDDAFETLRLSVTGFAEASSTNLLPEGSQQLCVTSDAPQVSNTSNPSRPRKSSDVPVFDPAAPAVDHSDDDDDEDTDERAFDHPSTYRKQPWIWIPRDRLGLSEILANDLKRVGVDASDVGATMDEMGVVEVTRNPPDEEWLGGHDI